MFVSVLQLIPLEHKRKPGKLRQVYSKLKGKKDKQYIPLCKPSVGYWKKQAIIEWKLYLIVLNIPCSPKVKNELDKNSEKICENYQANFY